MKERAEKKRPKVWQTTIAKNPPSRIVRNPWISKKVPREEAWMSQNQSILKRARVLSEETTAELQGLN
jgi:hypothetical protein